MTKQSKNQPIVTGVLWHPEDIFSVIPHATADDIQWNTTTILENASNDISLLVGHYNDENKSFGVTNSVIERSLFSIKTQIELAIKAVKFDPEITVYKPKNSVIAQSGKQQNLFEIYQKVSEEFAEAFILAKAVIRSIEDNDEDTDILYLVKTLKETVKRYNSDYYQKADDLSESEAAQND